MTIINNNSPIPDNQSFSPLLNNQSFNFTTTPPIQNNNNNNNNNNDIVDYFSTDIDFDTAYMLITNETNDLPMNKFYSNSNSSSLLNISSSNNLSSNGLNSIKSTSSSSILPQTPQLPPSPKDLPHLSPIFNYQHHQQQQQQLHQKNDLLNIPTTPQLSNQLPIPIPPPQDTKSLFEQQRLELLNRPSILYQSPKQLNSNLYNDIGSPISPNTRNLLTTFNNLNYSATISNNNKNIINNNNSDLLSVNEYSALETFLDSIANDQSMDNLSKYWYSIDPMANNNNNNNTSSMNNNAPILKKEDFLNEDFKFDSPPLTRRSSEKIITNTNTNTNNNTNNNNITINISDSKITKPKSSSSSFTKSSSKINSKSIMNNLNNSKIDKKCLSEEAKKLQHTSSEQKRRAIIKNAFDELCNQIESEKSITIVNTNNNNNNKLKSKSKSKSKRKSMSKFMVMNKAIDEVVKLVEINKKLMNIVGIDEIELSELMMRK
ncbi:hypothetical protein CANARDRAFT_5497 [[Candida] arabinofermentans NRRL YB-2248]|uniref:BHLH domain-containing protein n=1 Tax=[Candida] arabinofermentans NRRL YB-2248 TaxID=983967 RepID=A0A1E4T964_9ASCO|nr:hypothetical protein CANARDRAFT_5497 [[Candida] arabinofermentans NRRL YB-2248]